MCPLDRELQSYFLLKHNIHTETCPGLEGAAGGPLQSERPPDGRPEQPAERHRPPEHHLLRGPSGPPPCADLSPDH